MVIDEWYNTNLFEFDYILKVKIRDDILFDFVDFWIIKLREQN